MTKQPSNKTTKPSNIKKSDPVFLKLAGMVKGPPDDDDFNTMAGKVKTISNDELRKHEETEHATTNWSNTRGGKKRTQTKKGGKKRKNKSKGGKRSRKNRKSRK